MLGVQVEGPLPDVVYPAGKRERLFRHHRRRARAVWKSPAAIAAYTACGALLLIVGALAFDSYRDAPLIRWGPSFPRNLAGGRGFDMDYGGGLGRRLAKKKCLDASTTEPDIPPVMCTGSGNGSNASNASNATFLAAVAQKAAVTAASAAANATAAHVRPASGAAVFADMSIFKTEDDKGSFGALLLHLLCIFYLFSGLAIVCDNYFEMSLDRISNSLNLAPEVSMATFMAVSGSAPELSVSIIGTFVARNDIGIGTIVGSAVFNVLLVIAMCAFVSNNLALSWWPLSRDATCYNIAIVMLGFFIFDGKVEWYESATLMGFYGLYVLLMKHNEPLRKWTDKQLANTGKPRGALADGLKIAIDSKFFTAFIYLAIISNVACIVYDFTVGGCGGALVDCMDPDGSRWCTLHPADTCCDTKALLGNLDIIFNVIFSLEFVLKHFGIGLFGYWRDPLNAFDGVLVLLVWIEQILSSDTTGSLKSLRMFRFFRALRALRILRFAKLLDKKEAKTKRMSLSMEAHSMPAKTTRGGLRMNLRKSSALPIRQRRLSSIIPTADNAAAVAALQQEFEGSKDETKEDETPEEEVEVDPREDPPSNPFERKGGCCGNTWWFFTLPLSVTIWVTIPDPRRVMFRNWYIVTFMMSALWIFLLSFMLVWMASEVAESLKIPPQVVGLTLLAIGTSVPDLMASIAVAKEGCGDQAVSSSIGSNIFDILIGLPLPWFIYSALWAPIHNYCNTYIETHGKALNIQILLIFVLVSGFMIAVLFSSWRLSKKLGGFLLFMYVLYITYAIMSEYDLISM